MLDFLASRKPANNNDNNVDGEVAENQALKGRGRKNRNANNVDDDEEPFVSLDNIQVRYDRSLGIDLAILHTGPSL